MVSGSEAGGPSALDVSPGLLLRAKVPWLYNPRTKIAISYEDPESIAAKAKYVVQKKLGGIMFWDLGQDDSKSTLLQAVHQAFSGD
jgi:GH18 family chitinase